MPTLRYGMNYMTTWQVANRIGVSPATIKRWSNQGILRPSLKTTSGHRRFDPQAVEDFVLKLEAVQLGVDPTVVDKVRAAEKDGKKIGIDLSRANDPAFIVVGKPEIKEGE